VITETVYFNLPTGISREEVLAKYRQTAPAWSKNQDLVQKYYFFDESKNLGGGVYIWKTLDAAKHWHGAEYQARIKALYGSEPQITYHDTLLVIDNVNCRVSEPAKA
jgi:hypothetical protein